MSAKSNSSQSKQSPGQLLIIIAGALVCITVFFLILFLQPPVEVGKFAYRQREWLLLVAFFPLYFAFRARSLPGQLLSFLIALVLFAMPLSYLWSGGVTTQGIIGGLLPLHDFFRYYTQARNLLAGDLIHGASAWRPIFSSFLAATLAIFHRNLQWTVAFLQLLLASSSFLAARELRRTHGPLAATFFFALLFFFFRHFTDSLGSEIPGFILGCLAFALLWRGADQKKLWLVLLGIFCAGLSQNARSAALVILPFLVLWAGWTFRKNKWFSFKIALLALGAVAAAFLYNSLAHRLYTAPGSSSFYNFAPALYGQAVGGAGLNQFYADYPGVKDPALVMEFTLDQIRRYPMGLVIGTIKAFKDWFTPGIFGDFSFIAGTGKSIADIVFWLVLNILLLFSTVRSLRKVKEPLPSLMLAFFLGIFFSLPFAPPIDSEFMEKYAASIPLFSVLAPLGLTVLLQKLPKWREWEGSLPADASFTPTGFFTGGFLALLMIGPLFVRLFPNEPEIQAVTCPADQVPFAVQLDRGSTLKLIPDGSAPCAGIPDLCASRFNRNGIPQGIVEAYDKFEGYLVDLNEPLLITEVNDLQTREVFFMMGKAVDMEKLELNGKPTSGCMTWLGKFSVHDTYWYGSVPQD
jgi:hypothetical protein